MLRRLCRIGIACGPRADDPVHYTDIDPGNTVEGHHHADAVFAFFAVLLRV
jgi:hypothetical protein